MSSAPDASPPAVGPLRRAAGSLFLKLAGWTADGAPPPHAKVVFIAAPHSSYWDVPFMLAVAWKLGIAPSWFAKHTVFRFPFRTFFRLLGGIPIDRRERKNVVATSVERFGKEEQLYLVISPPGTRSRTDAWKSGFYHVATGAGVPICCSYLDFRRKVGGIGPTFMPSDVATDMERLRDFYDTITPKHPERKSDIRLRS